MTFLCLWLHISAYISAPTWNFKGVLSGNPAYPVTYKKYLSKLHPCNPWLWQRPLDSYGEESEVWYSNTLLGKYTLGGFMNTISSAAKHGQVYTNHSLGATHTTVLHKAGHEARHIMRISGHKSEASICSYSNRLSEDRKRGMAAELANSSGCKATDEFRSNKKPKIQLVHHGMVYNLFQIKNVNIFFIKM